MAQRTASRHTAVQQNLADVDRRENDFVISKDGRCTENAAHIHMHKVNCPVAPPIAIDATD